MKIIIINNLKAKIIKKNKSKNNKKLKPKIK